MNCARVFVENCKVDLGEVSPKAMKSDIFIPTPEAVSKVLGADCKSVAEVLRTVQVRELEEKEPLPMAESDVQTSGTEDKYTGSAWAALKNDFLKGEYEIPHYADICQILFENADTEQFFDREGFPNRFHPDKLIESSTASLKRMLSEDDELSPKVRCLIEDHILAYRNQQRELAKRREEYPIKWSLTAKPFILNLATQQYVTRCNYGEEWHRATALNRSDLDLEKASRNAVNYAGPLAGFEEGLYSLSRNVRVLVTGGPNETVPPEEDADCQRTAEFILAALGEEQTDVFARWLWSRAPSDRILVFVGDSDVSQVLQDIISFSLGGRVQDAKKYLTGNTKTNYQLIQAEHLVYCGSLTLKVSRMLQEFKTARRTVTIPYTGGDFTIPQLWQRLTIYSEDEKGLKRIDHYEKNKRDEFIVLKVNPVPGSAFNLKVFDEEMDAFIAEFVKRGAATEHGYWYQNAIEDIGPDLENVVMGLPTDWKGTTQDFVKATNSKKGLHVIGRDLTALADTKPGLLTYRSLHGRTLYEKVEQKKPILIAPPMPKVVVYEE